MTDPTPGKAELVAAAGAALYGDRWVAPLARDLDVNTRTMERIARAVQLGEDYRVADGIMTDLHQLVDARGTALRDVSRALFKARMAGGANQAAAS